MTARLLASEEWGRIPGGSLPTMLPDLSPQNCAVVAVEDASGAIVASLGVLRVVQFEGLWVAPAHRNAGVERALLRAAMDVARDASQSGWAFCALADEQMEARVERLGGRQIPLNLWVMPLGGNRG